MKLHIEDVFVTGDKHLSNFYYLHDCDGEQLFRVFPEQTPRSNQDYVFSLEDIVRAYNAGAEHGRDQGVWALQTELRNLLGVKK